MNQFNNIESMSKPEIRQAMIDTIQGQDTYELYTEQAEDASHINYVFACMYLKADYEPSDETKQTLLQILDAHEPVIAISEGWGGIEANSNLELIEDLIRFWRAEAGLFDDEDDDIEAIETVVTEA
jgi:hypothetical protein